MLKFRSLGSGSGGNALVVEAHLGSTCTRVLVDAGFGPRELHARLRRAGLAAEAFDAVFLTHEHSDHTSGVGAFAACTEATLHATAGTAAAARLAARWPERLRTFVAGEVVQVGALRVAAYPVPHDAAEPTQFVLSDGSVRLGVLTDIGAPTDAVRRALDGVDALVLECNHDPAMLHGGRYPPFLKQRIASDVGHLSNQQAADLLGAIDRSRLHCIVAAHLSQSNNRPELAQQSLAAVLRCAAHEIAVASQHDGFAWREIG